MKSEKIITPKEFRENGYLQELNRKFLHPLGLSLSTAKDKDGNEELGPILDYRNDDEGIYFNIKKSDNERKERFKKNKNFINSQFNIKIKLREKILGFGIEPIE